MNKKSRMCLAAALALVVFVLGTLTLAGETYIKAQGCFAIICVSGIANAQTGKVHFGVSVGLSLPVPSLGIMLGHTPGTIKGWQGSATAAAVGPLGGSATIQRGGVGGEVCIACTFQGSLSIGYTW